MHPSSLRRLSGTIVGAIALLLMTLPALGQQETHADHDQSDAFWAALARNHTGRYQIAAGELKAASPADLNVLGSWGSVIEWPHVPVSASNLPDGRIMTFSSNRTDGFPAGPEFTYAAVWNPTTGAFLETPNHTHDMFCAHMVMLGDGRLLVNGGRNHVKTTSIFDFATNSWSQVNTMNHGRWYPTTVAMPDGTVFTASGSGQPNAANTAELWTEGTGWDVLTGIDWSAIADNPGFESHWWPHLFIDPQGDLFSAGPVSNMHTVTLGGTGTLTNLGGWLNDSWYSKHAAVAMYDEGKILIAGGATSETDGLSTARAVIMDINGGTPVVTEIAPMAFARRFANAIVLPNGEVLVVGGNTSGLKFSDQGTILPAEIWSPETGHWRTVASISEPRNYHSIALLLENGEVLSAGGGLCGTGCGANHQDGQVFTPPYLFDDAGSPASRPAIVDAPVAIGYAQPFAVQASGTVDYFSLVKASATTHAVNTDQRYLRLPVQSQNGDIYNLTSHANLNVLTPGYWMLFAVDTNGVPSVAQSILVAPVLGLSVLSPGDQFSRTGDAILLQPVIFNPGASPLTWSASGLPDGLSIDAATGLISGTIGANTSGVHTTSISVTDGTSSDTVDLVWYVQAVETGTILREWWTGIPGDAVFVLTEDPRFPDNPSGSDLLPSFEAPRDWGDTYGTRMRGFIHPLETGTYRFWIASDDNSSLLLSTSDDPADAVEIARVPVWTAPREWDKFAVQASADVLLEAGQRYYIEALHNEGGALDNVAVAWQTPTRPQEVIPGAFLSPYNGAPTLTTPPNQVHEIGAAVSLSIQATDPENDPLFFSATNLPDGLAIDAGIGTISGTVTAVGTQTVSVSVTDGANTASTSFDWTVDPAPAPLEIVAVSAPPVQAGLETTIALTISGPGTVSVEWDLGDGTTLTGGHEVTHTYASPGRYPVTAVASAPGETDQVSFFQNVHAPVVAGAAQSSSGIAVDDQGRVWNVNPDNNTVTVTDGTSLTVLAEIGVGTDPRSVAISSDGFAYVVCRGSERIATISTSTLIRGADLALPYASLPFGIVLADNQTGFVTLEGIGRVARVNLGSGTVTTSAVLGPSLRHLALTADGSELYVARFITPPLAGESTASVSTSGGGDVLVLDTAGLNVQQTVTLAYNDVPDTPDSARGVANYLTSPVVSPDGQSVWIPSKFDNIFRGQFRDGQSREHDRLVRGGISVIDTGSDQERTDDRLDFDDQSRPVAAVFGPRGNVFFTAHAESRNISAVDPILGQSITRFVVGRAPTSLALSADGNTLYVHNYLDRTIQALDVSQLTQGGGQIAITDLGTVQTVSSELLSTQVLLGKQLFNDGLDDRLAGQDYLSCASCHNDGGHDGRVWDLTDAGEGLRNTIDLRGRGGTDHGPVHWTANFDEIHDFENDIRAVFGGTGLLSESDFAATQDPLGPVKAGRSVELDALAAYVASLTEVGFSPHRASDGSLSAQALAGRDVFRTADCAACHSGSRFTDSPSLALHDIGTIKASSGQRIGSTLTGLDTPTLRGVWSTAPYLHDGSAATLSDAVTAHNGVSLTPTELSDLVTYLEAIDDQEAEAPTGGSPPVLSPVAEQSTLLDEAVSLQIQASEPDGDDVSFTATGLPDGLAIDSSGLISGAPASLGVFAVTVRATDRDGSDAVQFVWQVLQIQVPVVSTCYLVADNSEDRDIVTTLLDGIESRLGEAGTSNIEGIAFSPALGQLFAADQDRLGQIDLNSGAFAEIGSFGTADGTEGNGRNISDVDGLAFHPTTGVLYAVEVIDGELDLLVTIDVATGSVIPDAFGAGRDYVTLPSVAGIDNVDDIAIDPTTGTMYAVGTDGAVGTKLFTIDVSTGATAEVASIDAFDVEGMGFMADGRLFGTTGDGGRAVVQIDKVTGATDHVATLGAGGSDYESIDCLGQEARQRFSGFVFEDVDENDVFGGADVPRALARVELYRDQNGNRDVDASDTFLSSVASGTDGYYEFFLAGLGDFVARIDYASMPPAATPRNDNVAWATFTAEGQVDDDNLFPFALDQTASDLFCYAVADGGAGLFGGDVLTRYNKTTLVESSVGPTGTNLIEAAAFNPQQTLLFAANADRLGLLNVATGAFSEIGPFGEASGSVGTIDIDDVDGLTFDPNSGVLYGAARRGDAADLLIQIDPVTGAVSPGAFAGADYVVVDPIDGQADVDDLAIDPIDGRIYAVLNGDSDNGILVVVDRHTGATTRVANLDDHAVEGLTFDGDGTLLATRGSTFQEVVSLSKTTGARSVVTGLGVDGHEDYEAISCLTNQTNKTSGRVYADRGASIFDLGSVLPGLNVTLYRDTNRNGSLDNPDVALSSVVTDYDGRYGFQTASNGDFVVAVEARGAVGQVDAQAVSFDTFGDHKADHDFVVLLTATSDEPAVELPDAFELEPNYPNPFNPITTIGYSLPQATHVQIAVFDLTGRMVEILVDDVVAAGIHETRFDASSLPSGVYFYRMAAGAQVMTRSMVLMK